MSQAAAARGPAMFFRSHPHLLALLFVAASLSCNADARGRAINRIDGCEFVAVSAGDSIPPQMTCAEALNRVDVSARPALCELWNDIGGNPRTLLDLVTLMRQSNQSRQPHFHAFGAGHYLLEVPCNDGAYNQSSIFYRYIERSIPFEVALIRFPQPDGTDSAEIWSRQVSTRRALIVVYRKERGLGDAGYYARYAVNPRTLAISLLEAIEKKGLWDGRDPFHWRGRLHDKPAGKDWQRIYPSSAPNDPRPETRP